MSGNGGDDNSGDDREGVEIAVGAGQGPGRWVDTDAAADAAGTAWGIALLREAEPYRAPVGRKRRVQLALGYREGRRRRAIFRPAVAIALLIAFGCGAVASAEIGHWRSWARVASQVVRSRVIDGWLGRPAPAMVSAPAPGLAGVARRPAAPPAMVALADERPAPVSSRVVTRPHRAPVASAAPDEAAAVLDALRALRIDRDPVRARALLGRYLAQRPNGSLAEEALAISIEAAAVHHDPDVAALANRYLTQHPQGPFRTMAAAAKSRVEAPEITRR